MTETVTRNEFNRLEGRVDVLEGEVDGEKLVTRYVLEQTRRNGDDLAAIKTRLDRVETDLGVLKSDVGSLKSELHGLRRDLPGIVADTMRTVLREGRAT